MRICLFILNVFDFDSRARLICRDILNTGWKLDIIATTGGEMTEYNDAAIYRIAQPKTPFRQRRFIEYNIRAADIAGHIAADIYHAIDLDTLWAAVKAAKFSGAKVVYEPRELYTELLALNNRPLVKAFWRMLESKYIHQANQVVTINQSIAQELMKRYKIKLPEVVINAADSCNTQKPMNLRQEYDLDCRLVLVYQGVLRRGQGIPRALQAISNLPDVGLVLIGDGPLRSELEHRVAILNLSSRVKFAGMISPERLPEYTSGGDAGLLLMEPAALNNYLALPQKLFQYIEAGIPPVVTDLPELKRIVELDDLGLVLPAASVDNDTSMISEFLNNELESAKARCASIKGKYNWATEGKKMLEIYRRLAG